MRRVVILVVVVAGCAGILGLKRAGGPTAFPHRSHVRSGIACTECHQGIVGDGKNDAAVLHLPSQDACLRCHPKPHDTRECLSCHADPMTLGLLLEDKQHLRFEHSKHHDLVASGKCVTCHAGVGKSDERLAPTMGTCLGCHQHKDQFRTRECDGCHVDVTTEMSRPKDHLVHDDDFLRDHGTRAASSSDLCSSCHKERFCAGCHGATVPALPSTIHFDQPTSAGMHRAGFRSRHAEEARAEPTLCTSCHAPETCVSCHDAKGISANGARQSPHPAGWVGIPGPNDHGPAARRDPVLCAGCHEGAGEAMCVSCHKVGGVGGNPHPPGFDSRLPLSALPCRLCHRGP
jgi:hypothetical protein